MEALLVKYGYALLFFGVMVEGEAFLLGAAFLAHRGVLHLPLVILVAVLANSVADQAYYTLANAGEPRGTLERGVALLFERLNSFYGYKNLFQFKSKFAPRWEARHIVFPRGADLPRVALALADLHSGGGLRGLLGRR